MKYLGWLLVLFAAAVAIGTAAHNSAYVLLVYPPYRIDMSLTLFVIFMVLLLLSAYSLTKAVTVAVGLPAQARRFRAQRARVQRQALLNKALDAYGEGRYAAAEREALRAMEAGESTALHRILAASAAHELHEYARRDAYLAMTGHSKNGQEG